MEDSPGGPASGEGVCYVVTLCICNLPMVLQVPFVDALEGVTVFRSRVASSGDEQYRLHVGYFDSVARALEVLKLARRYYPDAWISSAPRSRLSSLNDTLNTAFQLLAPAAAERAADITPPPAAPPAVAPQPAAAAIPAPEPPAAVAIAAPEPVAAAASEAAPQPAVPAAPAPVPQPEARSAAAAGPQRYAVQLEYWEGVVNSAPLPRLAVFRAYNLYSIRTPGTQGPQYGMRLGFFRDVDAARTVAAHVRPHYPRAGVVPVSAREFARVVDLTQLRARQAIQLAQARDLQRTATDAAAAPAAVAQRPEAAPLTEAGTRERSTEELFVLFGADDLLLAADQPERTASAATPPSGRRPPRRTP